MDRYPLREDKDDYVFFLGRADEEKAPHLAIEAARRAGRRLVMCVTTKNERERRYWARARRADPGRRRRGPRRVPPRAEGRPAQPGGRPGLPDPVGRALRPGHDRGHGLRDPGGGLAQRVGARGGGRRRDRVHRLLGRGDGHRLRLGRGPRPAGDAGPGHGAVLGRGHGRRLRARLRTRPAGGARRRPRTARGSVGRSRPEPARGPAPGWGGPPRQLLLGLRSPADRLAAVVPVSVVAPEVSAPAAVVLAPPEEPEAPEAEVPEVLGEVGTLGVEAVVAVVPPVLGVAGVVVVVVGVGVVGVVVVGVVGVVVVVVEPLVAPLVPDPLAATLSPAWATLSAALLATCSTRAPRSPGTLSTTRFTCGFSSSWLTLAVICS